MKKSAARKTIAVLGLTLGLLVSPSGTRSLRAQWISRKPRAEAEEAAQRRQAERNRRMQQLNTAEKEKSAPEEDAPAAEAGRASGNADEDPAGRFAPNPAQGVLLAQATPQDQPGGAAADGNGAAPAQAQAGGAAAAAADDDTTRIEPNPENRGDLPSFAPGEYPIESILVALADVTQTTLLLDNSQAGRTPLLDGTIKIIAPIERASEEMLKALLAASNIRVHRRELKDGTEVIEVEPMQTTGAQTKDPTPRKVFHATDTFREGEIDVEEIPPDEFATMIFTLKYVTPRDAINALQSLISGTGTGATGARGATAARLSSSFSMVEIENTQMLIVTAKFGLLDYLKTLLNLIDVPIEEPERIIDIKQIEWADASEIEAIVSEFIQGRGRGAFGRVGQRQITSPAAARAGQSGAPTTASQRGQTDYSTKLIPDVRTNKLIIETYNEQDLQDIEMLISELDVRFDLRRQRTHIYQVRYLKAEEVAQDLERLIQGQTSGLGTTTRRSTRSGLSRTGSTIPRVGARTGVGAQPTGGGAPQNVEVPTMIVPHVPTNSLMIQGEKEEYDEILNILSRIDTKRRQVFLEAALVQVQSNSSLNYAIETIAGDPDDRATRGLFASNFGLTGIDFDTWDRQILGSETGLPPTGGIFALMHRGDFPILVNFLKRHGDSQILATPFILADDNEQNRIDILETRYVQNTAVQNNQTTLSSQQGEPAGITLSIEPTISGSEKAVFLTMDLSVSEFQEATSEATLPPKNENTLTSAVTIPDGKIIVVGGLTRENKSKAVQKVPILGDIPLLGKLFRSENTVNSKNNLYVFLQAHVLTDEGFRDTDALTDDARGQMAQFADDLEPIHFEAPDYPGKGSRRIHDADADRFFQINDPDEGVYDPYEAENSGRRDRDSGTSQTYNDGARRGSATGATGTTGTVPASPRSRGWVGSRSTAPETTAPREKHESTGWFD